MRPDPTTLALFVAAVEEGTIAAAAVSTRLSELEDQLGTRLLRPSNKAIEATAAGVALLGLARGVLHALDEAVAQMGEYSSGVRGATSAPEGFGARTGPRRAFAGRKQAQRLAVK